MNNLYLVTCCNSSGIPSYYDAYVLAACYDEAVKKALAKMRDLGYSYTSFVDEVKLIAGDQYKAPKLLVT